MIAPFSTMRNRAFPELVRLGDASQRNRVWIHAMRESGVMLPWAAVPGVASFGIFYVSWVKFSVSLGFYLLLPIMGVMCFGGWSLLALLFRERLRRSIWNQLAQLAIGTCLNCGYDLTGNTSGVCPECGSEVKAIEPKPRPKPAPPLVQAVVAFVGATGLILGFFVFAGWLLWGVDTESKRIQDIYAVVCTCIAVVAGYLVARRTYRAARKTY